MARSFYIDSELVKVLKDWNINSKINAKTTAQATIIDLGNLTEINIGDDFEIYDGATKIFGGTIQTIDEQENDPRFIDYLITATDYNGLATKRIVADSVVNTAAGTIISTNIITNILSEEGVTAGTIQTGPTIAKAVFNYITCEEALDQIKNITGYNWNINYSKQLNFFKNEDYLAPFTLSDSVQHFGFTRTRTRDQYRNRQYVRAGRGKTNTQTDEVPTPKPDGVSRKFILRFPVAEAPSIDINGTPISSSDIGVNGLDTGKKYYYSYGSNIITQDESETVLSSTDTIEVTYKGLYPILTLSEDPSQINDRQTKETGTSGKYETLTRETDIDQTDQAQEFANGLLLKYGKIEHRISFTTHVGGLEAGMLLPVNKSLYNINSNYLIETVDIFTDGVDTIYTVNALDGSALGGWEEYFKELIKGNRQLLISENEVLILLNTQSEVYGYSGSVNIQSYEILTPSNTLYPSDTLYPGTLTSEEDLDD